VTVRVPVRVRVRVRVRVPVRVTEISPYKLRMPPADLHDREDLFFDVSF
jgi:hypothetical protein